MSGKECLQKTPSEAYYRLALQYVKRPGCVSERALKDLRRLRAAGLSLLLLLDYFFIAPL